MLHVNWLIVLQTFSLVPVWSRTPVLPHKLHWFCPLHPGRSWKWLKMTSYLSPWLSARQSGHLPSFASLLNSFSPSSRTNVLLPFQELLLHFLFWDLTPSAYSLVSYFWCCSSEGRDVPSNFSLARYNLLSWGSFWCLTCHPSQLGLLQHCCLHVASLPQSQLWSFVPFSCHLCTLLIFTVGWGELILSMFSGSSPPVSVSLLKFIQKQLHWGFS